MDVHVEVYRSGLRRDWFWRFVAANGRILADGSEGYSNLNDLLNSLSVVTGANDMEAMSSQESAIPHLYLFHRNSGDLRVVVDRG